MSYGIATWTRIAGAAQGTFLDDLTTRMSSSIEHQHSSCCFNTCIRMLATVGGWPKELDIVRITNITVYSGSIIDSVRITYLLSNNKTITVPHGGPGGIVTLNLDIAGDFLFYFWMTEICSLLWNYSKPESRRCLWPQAQ